jgi:hypothetical protein
LNSDFRNLNVENGKLKSSKRLNETLWSTESEKLKSRIFDMESELKNLQYELLAKEEILRNSVAVSDITEVQEQNEIISNKVHFIKKKGSTKTFGHFTNIMEKLAFFNVCTFPSLSSKYGVHVVHSSASDNKSSDDFLR